MLYAPTAAGWIREAVAFLTRVGRRKRYRLSAQFHAILSCPGGDIHARGVDATRHGIGVLASEPLQCGCLIFIDLPQVGLGGFAHVRRCQPLPDGQFAIGVEFRDSLSHLRPELSRWEFGRWRYIGLNGESRGLWNDSEAA